MSLAGAAPSLRHWSEFTVKLLKLNTDVRKSSPKRWNV